MISRIYTDPCNKSSVLRLQQIPVVINQASASGQDHLRAMQWSKPKSELKSKTEQAEILLYSGLFGGKRFPASNSSSATRSYAFPLDFDE